MKGVAILLIVIIIVIAITGIWYILKPKGGSSNSVTELTFRAPITPQETSAQFVWSPPTGGLPIGYTYKYNLYTYTVTNTSRFISNPNDKVPLVTNQATTQTSVDVPDVTDGNYYTIEVWISGATDGPKTTVTGVVRFRPSLVDITATLNGTALRVTTTFDFFISGINNIVVTSNNKQSTLKPLSVLIPNRSASTVWTDVFAFTESNVTSLTIDRISISKQTSLGTDTTSNTYDILGPFPVTLNMPVTLTVQPSFQFSPS